MTCLLEEIEPSIISKVETPRPCPTPDCGARLYKTVKRIHPFPDDSGEEGNPERVHSYR